MEKPYIVANHAAGCGLFLLGLAVGCLLGGWIGLELYGRGLSAVWASAVFLAIVVLCQVPVASVARRRR